MKNNLLLLAAAVISLVALPSCTSTSGGSGLSAYQAYDRPASLPTNPSAVRVKVSLRNQMIYVMEGSKPLLIAPCTVGTSSTPTPQGNFRIYNKVEFKRANSHGWAHSGDNARKANIGNRPSGWSFKGTPMPYWCEFKPNYGIHTGWVKSYPSSHGCIRMHENLSPKFYRLVKVGTPLSISSSQPEDATIGKNIPRPPCAQPLPDYHHSMYVGNGYFRRHKTPTYE